MAEPEGGTALAPLTARDVLSDDAAAVVDLLRIALDAAMDHPDSELASNVSETTSNAVKAEAAQAIDQLLSQLLLDDLLSGGWLQLAELQTALQETSADGGSARVALKQHTISSSHRPSLDLVVNQVTTTLMHLEIELKFDIAAGELVVEAGRVTGIAIGSLIASIALSAAGQPLVHHQTEKLDLNRLFPGLSRAGS